MSVASPTVLLMMSRLMILRVAILEIENSRADGPRAVFAARGTSMAMARLRTFLQCFGRATYQQLNWTLHQRTGAAPVARLAKHLLG